MKENFKEYWCPVSGSSECVSMSQGTRGLAAEISAVLTVTAIYRLLLICKAEEKAASNAGILRQHS